MKRKIVITIGVCLLVGGSIGWKLYQADRRELAWYYISNGQYRTLEDCVNLYGYASDSHITKCQKELEQVNFLLRESSADSIRTMIESNEAARAKQEKEDETRRQEVEEFWKNLAKKP